MLTRRSVTTGLLGLAATPLLPELRLAAAQPPRLVLSKSMQEALRIWLSYHNEYLDYAVAPIGTLRGEARQRFIDAPWPGERAIAIGRLTKYTDRLINPADWYRHSNDAEVVCWVMDQFYAPDGLPYSDWALEEFDAWNNFAFHLIYMAYAENGLDIPDRILDRMQVWRRFIATRRHERLALA